MLRVTVSLPDNVVGDYEKQVNGASLEKVLASRLALCKDFTAQKPLYFSDAQRQELEKTLGANFNSSQEALDWIKGQLRVTVHGAKVNFHPLTLTRLKSRCMEPDFQKWLENKVLDWAETYVGLG